MLDVPTPSDKSFADGKILQSVTDGVGVITFNNPEKRNAMSLDMWEGLGHALTELRDDADVRVVIMVGAGDKAFVAGADISQFEKTRHNAEASEEYSKRSAAQRALLADYPKPTIACIRGFCLGGGMQVAMLADIRIAAENSQFGIPAAKLGIAYGYDGLKHLVSLVGPSWARLLMYTGMRIESPKRFGSGWWIACYPMTNSGTRQPRSPAQFRRTRRWRSRRPRSRSPKCFGIPRRATWTRSKRSGLPAWIARTSARVAAPSWKSASRISKAASRPETASGSGPYIEKPAARTT